MRYERWQSGIMVGIVVLSLLFPHLSNGQSSQTAPVYVPDTAPWIPLIDECIAAGGQRNECIEALPAEVYADFIASERSSYAERIALGQLARTPWVPPPELLPDIYYSPASVPEIPTQVAESLAASGCWNPQSLSGRPNVVIGELAAAGQQDIAVICSVDGTSQIRIFWGGPVSCPPLEYTSPDWALLYWTIEWEYFWAIALSPPQNILSYYERYPEECPLENLPVMIHDGLEDITGEKGSANLYCHEGRWLNLCGAD